jgi:hypothetical protein
MPNICPQLTPLYTQWKTSLESLSLARLRFIQTGEMEDHEKIIQLQAQVEAAREVYNKQAYETLVPYGKHEICTLEAIVLEAIDQRLQEGGGDEVVLTVNAGRVVKIDVCRNQSHSVEATYSLLPLLTSLQVLDLEGTKVLTIPDALLESLLWLDFTATEAANNLDIIAKLDKHQQAHPEFKYFI